MRQVIRAAWAVVLLFLVSPIIFAASAQSLTSYPDIDRLTTLAEAAPPAEREAFLNRRDQRALRLLKAPSAASLEDITEWELAQTLSLIQSIDRSVLTRMVTSADDDTASDSHLLVDSYRDALSETHQALLALAADWLAVLPAERVSGSGFDAWLRDQVAADADLALGQLSRLVVEYQALLDLSATTGEPDLATEVALAEYHLERVMSRLTHSIALLEELGLPSEEYRRGLAGARDRLSLDLLAGDQFTQLWQTGIDRLARWWAQSATDVALQTVLFVIILVIARTISRFVRRLVRGALARSRRGTSKLLADVLVSLSGAVVMVIGLLVALAQAGISLAPMLAGLGVAGFIIGFAMQDTLSNFAAGAMILLYRPFDMDDYIAVAGIEGTVKHMNLVSTTITTVDNKTLIVPNSKIWGDVIRNFTGQTTRRIDLEFGISYSDDIELAERVLADIIAEVPAILSDPAPVIRVHRLGESSVDFVVRPWVATADYWETHWLLQKRVKQRFDEVGITIPFPQRDVHVHGSAD